MTDIPNSKGAPPPPPPGRRSASAALPPQVARALRATGPQRPTGRIGQGPLRGQGSRRREPVPNVAAYSPRRHPLNRHKIVLETPQRGVEKPKPRITPKRTILDSDTTLSFTESGGFAGLAKRCVVSVDSIPRKAKAGVAVVRRLKEILVPPSRGRDLMVYRLRLKGPKGEKLIHFDERTVPAKARSLIAFLSDQARPVDSV